MTSDEITAQLTQAKHATKTAKDGLLATFAQVPDDKLHWSPSETARTPLWIVAHCGESNKAFSAILRGEPLQLPQDPAEANAMIRNSGKDAETRDAAIKLVEESVDEILHALDTATPERLQSMPKGPTGPMPFTVWMQIAPEHMKGHTQQVAYLQTVWGDLEDHA